MKKYQYYIRNNDIIVSAMVILLKGFLEWVQMVLLYYI